MYAARCRTGLSERPPWPLVAASDARAVALWAAASLGCSLPVATASDYGSTYGAIGATAALLIYLRLEALALLLGAEVNVTVSGPPRPPP